MAKTAQGWRWVVRRGVRYVRFTHQGRRYDVSTRTRDVAEAQAIAERIYADVVTGRARRVEGGALTHPGASLDELTAKWLVAMQAEVCAETIETYTRYASLWLGEMPTVGSLTAASAANYMRKRLREVQAITVGKELYTLQRFVTWMAEQRFIDLAPDIPRLPKKALGTKRAGVRGRAAELQREEVQAVLAALPTLSNGVPVQAYCTVLYETALRPQGTVGRLVWSDVTPFGLHIRSEADKNRWERTVPLSTEARAALDGLPGVRCGLIFGCPDIRDSFDTAVRKALGERREGATPYCLKHARITHWFEDGASIPAVKFLTGITQTATLDRYARASRRAAESLVSGSSMVTHAGEAGTSETKRR